MTEVSVVTGIHEMEMEDAIEELLRGAVSPSDACGCDDCLMILLETRRQCLVTPGRTALLGQIETKLRELWKIGFVEMVGLRPIDEADIYDKLLADFLAAQRTAQELDDSKEGEAGLVHRIIHSHVPDILNEFGVVYYAETE